MTSVSTALPHGPAASATTARNADDSARLDAEIVAMIEQYTPFQKYLGIKAQSLSPLLVLRFDWRPDLVGHLRLHNDEGLLVATAAASYIVS